MRRVLVSFIGTGKKAAGRGEKQEYEKALYELPDGSMRESSLITSVLFKFLNPSKLIVLGTRQSIWSELLELIPPEDRETAEKNKIYEKIFDETWGQDVKSETLKEWEKFLSETLNIPVSLRIIPTESEGVLPESTSEEIVRCLYEDLPRGVREIYLDITHAFRYFPLVAAFALPLLKYVKSFQEVKLVYGKLVKRPDTSKVFFLKIQNRLISLLEAVSLSESTGNFEKFSDVFDPQIRLFKTLYLDIETNRLSRGKRRKLSEKLQEKENTDDIVERIAWDYVKKKVMPILHEEEPALNMARRAVFYAQRKQFLKAYTLIYEAMVRTQVDAFSRKGAKQKWEEARGKLKDKLRELDKKVPGVHNFKFCSSREEVYNSIRNLRNCIAHGDESPNCRKLLLNNGGLIDEDKLIQFVIDGRKLVKELISLEEKEDNSG